MSGKNEHTDDLKDSFWLLQLLKEYHVTPNKNQVLRIEIFNHFLKNYDI